MKAKSRKMSDILSKYKFSPLEVHKLKLNLASHPLRNRRLYFLIFIVLGFAFLSVSALGVNIYLKYKIKARGTSSSVIESDQMTKDARRDETRYARIVEEQTLKYKGRVDLINSLIFRKSFSWVNFLSDLESALPQSCYIVSLAPVLKGDSKIEVRFKVASPDYEELLNLYTRLDSMAFSQIKIRSETRSADGFLLAEISSIYERTI